MVAVVGAGPAGLAVAAALDRRGITHVVFDRADEVGASWRERYDSLRLHTARRLSALPGLPIPTRFGRWVRRDDVRSYLRSYAARFGIEPRFGVEVTALGRLDDGGWRVKTSEGPREARAVVVATGLCHTPYVPDWPGLSGYTGLFSHATTYRSPEAYAGRSVLVVGPGNTGAEIATELSRVATVELSVRGRPNLVRRATLGIPSQYVGIALSRLPERVLNHVLALLRRLTVPDLTAYGLPAPDGDGYSHFLRTGTRPILDHGFVAAVQAGRIAVVPAVESFDGDEVRLADGSVRRPDAVIAATGYRTGLDRLVGSLPVLDERGMPLVHGGDTLPEAPGLFFVGIEHELTGLLRLIGAEAVAVARTLART